MAATLRSKPASCGSLSTSSVLLNKVKKKYNVKTNNLNFREMHASHAVKCALQLTFKDTVK